MCLYQRLKRVSRKAGKCLDKCAQSPLLIQPRSERWKQTVTSQLILTDRLSCICFHFSFLILPFTLGPLFWLLSNLYHPLIIFLSDHCYLRLICPFFLLTFMVSECSSGGSTAPFSIFLDILEFQSGAGMMDTVLSWKSEPRFGSLLHCFSTFTKTHILCVGANVAVLLETTGGSVVQHSQQFNTNKTQWQRNALGKMTELFKMIFTSPRNKWTPSLNN